MSEMVERVAKAIREWTQDDIEEAREAARAAIQAMREPTDAMCEAADWTQQSEVNQYQRAIDEALK